MSRIAVIAAFMLATSFACQGTPEARKPDAPASQAAAPTTQAAATPAVSAAAIPQKAPYTIHIAAGEAAVGKPATSVIEVRPATGFHINKEFPARLRVSPTAGVTLAKADLSKEDAELTDELLRFSVPFNASGVGKVSLAGLGDFSVCNDSTCKLIRDEKLSWDVDVKP